MTTFGSNMKLTAAKQHRERLHTVLTEGLGCQSLVPEEDFAVYAFSDGFNLGVYFVAAADALSETEQVKAPWLELRVEDVSDSRERLDALDVDRVPYPRDPEHVYYRLPGGPVFRLDAAQ